MFHVKRQVPSGGVVLNVAAGACAPRAVSGDSVQAVLDQAARACGRSFPAPASPTRTPRSRAHAPRTAPTTRAAGVDRSCQSRYDPSGAVMAAVHRRVRPQPSDPSCHRRRVDVRAHAIDARRIPNRRHAIRSRGLGPVAALPRSASQPAVPTRVVLNPPAHELRDTHRPPPIYRPGG